MIFFFRWLGEDLSVYDEDKDLREVDIPAIKNMVKGYAAYVILFTPK
jgi:long-chain alkane monooxygenase